MEHSILYYIASNNKEAIMKLFKEKLDIASKNNSYIEGVIAVFEGMFPQFKEDFKKIYIID